jgi:hypothetical protein
MLASLATATRTLARLQPARQAPALEALWTAAATRKPPPTRPALPVARLTNLGRLHSPARRREDRAYFDVSAAPAAAHGGSRTFRPRPWLFAKPTRMP